MASSRHREHLKQYFSSHKGGGETGERMGGAADRPKVHASPSRSRDQKKASKINHKNEGSPAPHPKGPRRTAAPPPRAAALGTKVKLARPTADGLPEEILRDIFSLLNPNDLLICARVCRRWLELSNDNKTWEKVYERYAQTSKRGGPSSLHHPVHPPPGYWKNLSIKRCSEVRNKTALSSLKKLHPFTGLPANTEKALRTAGVGFCLWFLDCDGEEHVIPHRDVFYFSMATCVRWYSLVLPPINNIRKLKLYAANPVFFNAKGAPHPNSPCQRSLLFEMDFRWSSLSSTTPVITRDESINVVHIPNNLIIATFKDGGELAFISTTLHHHRLVERCLLGQSDSPYILPEHVAKADDLDTKRGLHSYNCTIELRNQRNSFYSQQFRDLYCQAEELGEGYARFRLIREESSFEHSPVGKKISFPWKSDLFKGIVENVCFLDLTLLDESAGPMWCVSAPVKVAAPSLTDVVYDYDGDHYYIDYVDPKGKVKVKLVWEEDIGQYIIMVLDVMLSTSHINQWFLTTYK